MELFVLAVFLAIFALLFFLLGGLPGRVARSKHHPQADLITMLGWVGFLLFFVLWILALVWAYMPGLGGTTQLQTPVACKKCPRCAENIRPEATYCRFCQYDWTPKEEHLPQLLKYRITGIWKDGRVVPATISAFSEEHAIKMATEKGMRKITSIFCENEIVL